MPPSIPYRLVACDLDGTLQPAHLGDVGITPRTRAALARATAAGAHVVVVTGRPTHRVTWLAELAGTLALELLCDNGASRYDPATGTATVVAPIAPARARAVMASLAAAIPGVYFAVERVDAAHWGLVHEPGWVPHASPIPALAATTLDGHLDGRIAKLCARHDSIPADALCAAVRAQVGGLVELAHGGASVPGEAEMTRAGTTKGTALQAVAARYGIRATETVAFGDMPNDVPMLTWAGRSYAMAAGHPAAVAAATGVAPPAAGDGVAVVLETLFPG